MRSRRPRNQSTVNPTQENAELEKDLAALQKAYFDAVTRLKELAWVAKQLERRLERLDSV